MDSNSSVPQLKPLSPSRLNSERENILPVTPTKSTSKILSNNNYKAEFTSSGNKENSFSSITKPSGNAKVDLSQYTSDELKYYEYLCRATEVKRWIEQVINEELPPEVDLCAGDALRNGVYLAQVVQAINPELIKSVFPAGNKLQFKHTQNINAFFSLVEHVGVPDSFRFELQDLYNKKDLPQVFETLHIIISIINKKWPGKTPNMKNLSGQLSFSNDDIRKCKRAWPRIRDFKSLGLRNISSGPNIENNTTQSGLIEDFNDFKRLGPQSTSAKTPERKQDQKMEAEAMIYEPTTERTSSVRRTEITPVPTTDYHNYEIPSSPTRYESPHRKYSPIPTFKSVSDTVLSNTPYLEYSPLKTSTLSYYSPTISRYMNNDRDLKFYDTYEYSPSRYSPARKQRMTEDEFLTKVLQLQSKCRGINVRFSLRIQNHLLRLFAREMSIFQGKIRGDILRKKNNIHILPELNDNVMEVLIQFQSQVKANMIRFNLDKLRIRAVRNEHFFEKFQVKCKGVAVRIIMKQRAYNIDTILTTLINLQGFIKAKQIRTQVNLSGLTLESEASPIKSLQWRCRAMLIRMRNTNIINNSNLPLLITLQSTIKGSLLRRTQNTLTVNLSPYQDTITKFSALLNGFKVRQELDLLVTSDFKNKKHIILLQAKLKGILVRYALDLVDDIVERNNLISVQSIVKGYIIRFDLKRNRRHFYNNVHSVIMVQSWIRMKSQRKAYQEFMQIPNPTLKSVKKFIHLLNGCKNIEEGQNKLESSQASLDAENIRKEKLQLDIRKQLDLIDVLDKFGLSHNVDSQSEQKTLNIPKYKYPVMEKLFYLLQVDPTYWKAMFLYEPEFTKKNIYITFTTLNKKMSQRERIYFTRFVKEIMLQSLEQSISVSVFLTEQTYLWKNMVSTFLQTECYEKFSLVEPLLRYLTNPSIDFEADPDLIYKKVYGIQPTKTDVPIEDEKVKGQFITNLRNIWHAVEMVAEIFTRHINEIPIELRFLCTKLFCAFADRNASELDSLRGISKILIESFMAEYLLNCEYYGFQTSNKIQFSIKADILLQAVTNVFGLYPFQNFYDPLNQYSEEIQPHIKDLLYNVLVDPIYEQECDKMVYFDMSAPRPHLEILTTKILEVSKKFKEYSTRFSDGGALEEILKGVKDGEVVSKSSRIVLELDPTAYKFLVSDDKMRKWYDQTKRAFIYMMQVEDIRSNLYDLLMTEVSPVEEAAFQNFVQSNPIIAADPMLQQMRELNYSSLKEITLKKIQELEASGIIISSDNKLQNILNDIANTIKNPNYALDYVTEELRVTKETLNEINKINGKLVNSSRQLHMTIDKTIQDIQAAKSFEAPSKSTLGNIKSAYKKVHHKNGIELQGLKFKWSTRQLFEKGVLKSIVGEKLGVQTVKVFGSSGPKYPDIIFKISTSDGSKFGLQLVDKRKGPEKKYSELVDSFMIKELLATQVGKTIDEWNLLNKKVTINTTQLLRLLVATFYK